jgi:chorismate mutase
VDRIDLRILRLLQQRTKLSRRIGEVKRRYRALVYVPERERELLRRIARLSRGKLSSRAARAIFREILSSSRAEQNQAPVGYLHPSAAAVLPAVRGCFGACDRFEPRENWAGLARGLGDGSLAVAVLTAADLAPLFQTPAASRAFQERFSVAGDFLVAAPSRTLPSARLFIVVPQRQDAGETGNRSLILIECKSTTNGVKRWLKSMSGSTFHVEQVTTFGHGSDSAVLMRLTSPRSQTALKTTAGLRSAGVPFAVLGVYQATEDDAE